MPTYWYRVVGPEKALIEGTLVADNRREALQRLVEKGQNPVDLREQATPAAETGGPQIRLARRCIRLATFTRQLATLSASGTPVLKGLSVLAEQTRDVRAKRVLSDVTEAIKGGSTFAEALGRHPDVFPKLMTSMVRVGELGGTLDEQLLQLSELYEREEALKGEVQSAMAYPALVLLLGLVSTFILVAFFIPRIEGMFNDAGQALPVPTQILLAMSHFITSQPWALLILAVGLAWGIRALLHNPQSRLFIDRAKLHVPWFGVLARNLEVARFTRVLGTLSKAGISIVEALRIVEPVMQNRAMAATVKDMVTRISSGDRLAELMKETNLFPPLSVQMVATGEETGHLDQMLLRLADAYDRETTASTKVMMSLLAPVLILFVAGIVGFILVSMILPIFQLSNVMR